MNQTIRTVFVVVVLCMAAINTTTTQAQNWEQFLQAGKICAVEATSNNTYWVLGTNLDNHTTLKHLDNDGNELLSFVYDDLPNKPYSLAIADNGDLLIGGGERNPWGGLEPLAFLSRISTDGAVLWTQIYTSFYCISKLSTTTNGAIYATQPDILGDDYELGEGKVLRLDAAGNIVWLNEIQQTDYDTFNYDGMIVTEDEGVIVTCGRDEDGAFSSFGWYVIKFNSDGEMDWMNEIVSEYDGNAATDIIATDDGNYVFASVYGHFTYGVGLVKMDAAGNEIWSRYLTGVAGGIFEDFVNAGEGLFLFLGTKVSETADNCLVLTGMFKYQPNEGEPTIGHPFYIVANEEGLVIEEEILGLATNEVEFSYNNQTHILGADNKIVFTTSIYENETDDFLSQHISQYNIGSNCRLEGITLPVELVQFEGKALNQEQIQLNWQTASELNNSHFVLEKSKNGFDFFPLTQIQGHGTSSTLHKYQHVDKSQHNSTNYYRLKQVDRDGQYEYSKVIKVQLQEGRNSMVYVYPNPATNQITVDFPTANEETINLQIFNSKGAMVYQQKWTGIDAIHETINISDLPNGVYVIHTTTASENYMQKLVVMH